MHQFSSLLPWRLFTAQHVSGVSPPIIRSSMTAVAASGFTFVSWWQSLTNCHHDTKVKPEAATAVIEFLMMGGKTPETCWAVNIRQDNKLENCCIWSVIYLNCTMVHGLTNLKFNCSCYGILCIPVGNSTRPFDCFRRRKRSSTCPTHTSYPNRTTILDHVHWFLTRSCIVWIARYVYIGQYTSLRKCDTRYLWHISEWSSDTPLLMLHCCGVLHAAGDSLQFTYTEVAWCSCSRVDLYLFIHLIFLQRSSLQTWSHSF